MCTLTWHPCQCRNLAIGLSWSVPIVSLRECTSHICSKPQPRLHSPGKGRSGLSVGALPAVLVPANIWNSSNQTSRELRNRNVPVASMFMHWFIIPGSRSEAWDEIGEQRPRGCCLGSLGTWTMLARSLSFPAPTFSSRNVSSNTHKSALPDAGKKFLSFLKWWNNDTEAGFWFWSRAKWLRKRLPFAPFKKFLLPRCTFQSSQENKTCC